MSHANAPARFPVFSADEVEALYVAVKIHDDIYPDAVLPDAIPVRFSQDQWLSCYALSRQYWLRDVDHNRFIALVDHARKTGTMDTEQRVAFKEIRAAYKQLNFSCVTMDERHRYPRYLRWVTGVMGHLQDALKYGDPAMVKRYALAMRAMLSAPSLGIVHRLVDGFQPSTTQSFVDFVAKEVENIRTAIAPAELTGHGFHNIRKIISRQVATYDCLGVLYPAPDVQATLHSLSTINGLMGSYHDGLVERQINGTQDYQRDLFAMPEEIRARLEALLTAYRF
jgi:hypothetical protein